jgi:hypothetical protein
MSYDWSRPIVAHTGSYLLLKAEVTRSNPTSDKLAKIFLMYKRPEIRVEYTSTSATRNKARKRCAAMPLATGEFVPAERVQQAPVKPPLLRAGSFPYELRLVATNRGSYGKLPARKSGGHGIESYLGQVGKNIPDVQKARN